MFTGTFRRDGYSGFGSNNPWGNFGSVGLSWVFSEENFMSDAHDWMDMGKLRLIAVLLLVILLLPARRWPLTYRKGGSRGNVSPQGIHKIKIKYSNT